VSGNFFVAAAVGMMLPESHWFRILSGLATFAFVVLGVCGAPLGIKFAFSTLYFGCPLCGQKSEVLYGNNKEMGMQCPACGIVTITGPLFGRQQFTAQTTEYRTNDSTLRRTADREP
jgi:hypothetical protein